MALQTKYQAENTLDLSDFIEGDSRLKVLFVGPYISNFSFAKVNRGLATAMAATNTGLDVKIWKEPTNADWIDRVAGPAEIAEQPEVAKLLTNDVDDVDITIFNSFPSNSNDPYGLKLLPGKTKLIYIAWEETVYPADKVTEINQNMHGVMAASEFTKKILRKNGVKIPIKVVHNSFDCKFLNYTPKKYDLQTKQKFKFLHVSSARARKGVDVLLGAYFNEFTNNDDVVLVIKSFPGPDNLVNELVGKLKKEHKDDAPEVLHIFNPDLTEEDLIDLTHTADACVYPTRAEGFGLPILESMYLGKPTIVTGYSGHMDFCNDQNSFLLDYKLTDATDSEFVNIGAKWAEPNMQQLQKYLRHVFENQNSNELADVKAQAHEDTKSISWRNSAVSAHEFITKVHDFSDLKSKSLFVITPINTVSGISEYSKDLYNSIEHSFAKITYVANVDAADKVREDDDNVVRLWEQGSSNLDAVAEYIQSELPDIVHVQFHSGEIAPQALVKLLSEIPSQIRVIVTPHDTLSKGGDFTSLSRSLKSNASKSIVHKQKDFDALVKSGLENLVLFPLPYDDYPNWDKTQIRKSLDITNYNPILVSHGIVSHHKGLLQTADAVAELKQDYPDILWLAVNAVSINNVSSSDTFEKLKQKVIDLKIKDNVILFPDFLDVLEILTLIEAADIGLLMYEEVGESASAAVRKFMASGTTTMVTDIPMLTELTDEVYKIRDNSPKNIVDGVKTLLNDKKLAAKISASALQTSKSNNWEVMAQKLLQIYRT